MSSSSLPSSAPPLPASPVPVASSANKRPRPAEEGEPPKAKRGKYPKTRPRLDMGAKQLESAGLRLLKVGAEELRATGLRVLSGGYVVVRAGVSKLAEDSHELYGADRADAIGDSQHAGPFIPVRDLVKKWPEKTTERNLMNRAKRLAELHQCLGPVSDSGVRWTWSLAVLGLPSERGKRAYIHAHLVDHMLPGTDTEQTVIAEARELGAVEARRWIDEGLYSPGKLAQ